MGRIGGETTPKRMNYPTQILQTELASLEAKQQQATHAETIADLQKRIEETTAAIEILLQANN